MSEGAETPQSTQDSPELASPKPKWEVEKQKVEDVLTANYGVKPRTPEQRNLSLLAKGVYDRTREQAQPFLDALFDDGYQKYFGGLSSAAYSINTALSPKKGDAPLEKTPEQLMEEASVGIVSNLADMFDHREKLKAQGLAERTEDLGRRWKEIDREKPELVKAIGDLDNAIKDAVESGASQVGWLIGLRVIQAKLHNNLDALDKDIKGKRPEGFNPEQRREGNSIILGSKLKPLIPEGGRAVSEAANQLSMEAIDNIERALPQINKHEWRTRFQTAQGELVGFLDVQDIRRLVPKVGQSFDPKWQMATAKNGQGDRINSIGRGAFVDKSTGRVIQEAWVETG